MDCKKGIIEVKNISTVRKHNFSKSAETKFYIRVKECSDLKVEQCFKSCCTFLTKKVKILIKVSNLGPDTEPCAKCTDLITNHKDLEIVSITVSKGSYTYDCGELKWNIGKLCSKESCFALITIKAKRFCLYKSIAITVGENHDPCLLNNFDIEIISPFDKCYDIGKLIYSCIALLISGAYKQLNELEKLKDSV